VVNHSFSSSQENRRLPSQDMFVAINHGRKDLVALRGKVVLITGGTGFIGSWLLETHCTANIALGLNLRLRVLSRDPAAFAARLPFLYEDAAIELIAGDVRTLEWDGYSCDAVIHAATEASAVMNRDQPLLMADTIVEGTRRTLEYARKANASRLLMLSSGGIYGKFPCGITHIREDDASFLDPLDPYFTYAESKRMGELLAALYHKQYGLGVSVARIFAVVGPRLPLDAHFAVGNFIGDVLNARPIRIQGDGTAVRSYIYAADLVVWLLAMLVRGKACRAYNVGSDQGQSIAELAQAVARLAPLPTSVHIVGRSDASNPISYYVPAINRARQELGLNIETTLDDAIMRTLAWHLSQQCVPSTVQFN
jgi:dTDP-glucose 4,6-dehydratase